MKQNITRQHLCELSDKAKKKLRKWWQPKRGDQYIDMLDSYAGTKIIQINTLDPIHGHKFIIKAIKATKGVLPTNPPISWKRLNLPLLSIGQMMEFLDQNSDMPYTILKKSEWHGGGFDVMFAKEKPTELTDTSLANAMTIKSHIELRDALYAVVKEVLDK